MKSMPSFEILYAEDDPDDQILLKHAIEEAGIKCNVHVFDNAQALLIRLFEAPLNRPALVLLDLNMPILDGWQVLKEIRQHPKLKNIPVVVLTTSSAEEDKNMCYKLGANCFITKPASFGEWVENMKALSACWGNDVELP